MTNDRRRWLILASVFPLLAACGGTQDERAADDRQSAAGEILPGSVSDAMLPLDILRSQGERLSETDGEPGDGGAGESSDDNSESTSNAG